VIASKFFWLLQKVREIIKMAEFLTSDNHSLGPWPKTRDTRLFSYHDRIFKVRLILTQRENEQHMVDDQSFQRINNAQLQADIDRCVASLLKKPPTKAAPTTFKVSGYTTFTVELRSWKADQKFIEKMHSSNMEVYPYSFKVSGQTTHTFYTEPSPQKQKHLDSSQSDGEKSITDSNENSDSDQHEEPQSSSTESTTKATSQKDSVSHSDAPTTHPENTTDTPPQPVVSSQDELCQSSEPCESPEQPTESSSKPPSPQQSMEEPQLEESPKEMSEKIVESQLEQETTQEVADKSPTEKSSTFETASESTQKEAASHEDTTTNADATMASVPEDVEITPTKAVEPEIISDDESPSPSVAKNIEDNRPKEPHTPSQEILENMDRVSLRGGDTPPKQQPSPTSSPRKRKSSRTRSGQSSSSQGRSGDSEQAQPAKIQRREKSISQRSSKKSSGKRSGNSEALEKSQRCSSPKRLRMDTGECDRKLESSASVSGINMANASCDKLSKTNPIETPSEKTIPDDNRSRRSCSIM